jgi:hypothetical protein
MKGRTSIHLSKKSLLTNRQEEMIRAAFEKDNISHAVNNCSSMYGADNCDIPYICGKKYNTNQYKLFFMKKPLERAQ